MELTFINDLGQSFVVDIDPGMELENVMALLEAESGIPASEQSITYEGRELSNPKATMSELGVRGSALLMLRRKVSVPGGRQVDQDAEMLRLQLLGNPSLMRQIQEMNPELATAAQSDPARFAQLLLQTSERARDAELARQREIERLNADPFDIEAQQRIEEAIRQQAVLENMEHALEWSPEAFGRVTMLYVPVEVNSHPVKAFVDSGAQQTIMSPECAEQCGLMRLVDKRFSGIARGVGTAKILGRVHSAQIKVADLYLSCSFTIMEGKAVDLLLGLDMLKAHQACIDLEKNVLRIQGREVTFLSEHELPSKARLMEAGDVPDELVGAGPSSSGGLSGHPITNASANANPTHFPGGGQTLGSAPSSNPGGGVSGTRPSAVQARTNRYPENHIGALVGLGASREQAIRLLDAAGGNVDVAASMLFG